MNKTKRGYEAPTSELLVVRFEQNFCASEFGAASWGSGSTTWWTDIDDDE